MSLFINVENFLSTKLKGELLNLYNSLQNLMSKENLSAEIKAELYFNFLTTDEVEKIFREDLDPKVFDKAYIETFDELLLNCTREDCDFIREMENRCNTETTARMRKPAVVSVLLNSLEWLKCSENYVDKMRLN